MNNLKNWRFILSVLIPIFLLPILFLGSDEEESKKYKCGYIILLMGIFWMLELIPLSITALFPVVLFPFFGIQSTSQVVASYMKETQMMFIGGISIALALQYSGLHRRLALRIMILIGSSPWRLLLGILITTTLLSCVIVINTAVAAMMSPIVIGLVESTGQSEVEKGKLRVVFMLAVAYGANIGGTSTIIGSQPNLIYNELIEKENIGQNGKYTDLNFFTFFAYSMPIALINMLITWLILGAIHLGFKRKNSDSNSNALELLDPTQNPKPQCSVLLATKKEMGEMLQRKYAELGRMSFHEIVVSALLSLAVLLWLTRDPQILPGWLNLFPKNQPKIGNSSIGIAIVVFMFIIPQKITYFQRNFEGKSETILTWEYIQTHFPWNVIFIVGGGLAISEGSKASGLSKWVGQELIGLETLPSHVILLVLLITISVFTEVMSNAATVSLLTPILISISKKLKFHPLYLTLPGAIASQYAFMFPTSNPPNALVFNTGKMRMIHMVKSGIFLNFACISILYFMNVTWGDYVIFNYRDYKYVNSTEN